jgi:hypothetical protein
MRQSLLELVQTTLSLMDSDKVDSITETEESEQVCDIARDVYYELINRQDWPFLHGGVELVAGVDTTQPTKFTLADTVKRLTLVQYNTADDGEDPAYRELCYVEPEVFLRRNSVGGDNSLLVEDGQVRYYVTLDRQPTYYTSFQDGVLVADAVDQTIETTLQESKLSVLGYIIPEFAITDAFVPTLPDNLWPMYSAEVRRACFLYLKQTASIRDEAVAIRQTAQARRGQRNGTRTYFNTNFGRR